MLVGRKNGRTWIRRLLIHDCVCSRGLGIAPLGLGLQDQLSGLHECTALLSEVAHRTEACQLWLCRDLRSIGNLIGPSVKRTGK